MSVKINQLELENVKRIKAVKMSPSPNGLTIIGGKNNQGKTSVLDAIAWALGGNNFKPSKATREGSVVQPHLKVVLDNGFIVERKGKNSDLKVIDPKGNKAGQSLLNEFIEQFALNVPKFLESSNKEKATILLNIIGVGEQLYKLEKQEIDIYNDRRAIGQIADRKAKAAEEMTFYPNVPKQPVSAKELIDQQQEILAKNGENARKRQKVEEYQRNVNYLLVEVKRLEEQLNLKKNELKSAQDNLLIAQTDTLDLHDQSTEALERNIEEIDEINRKVRSNLDKEKAEQDAQDYQNQYVEKTILLENVRKQKMDLLNNADLPLPELSVQDGDITYQGQKWDNMSGSDQLKVATAIVRKLNPNCGFVLLDKLEQMDIDTMNEFGKWLEDQNLQAIATRVSTGNECSIIIEDGYIKGQEIIEDTPKVEESPKWKAGEF